MNLGGISMDLGEKARQLERKITRSVDAAMTEFIGREATTPLEIVHGVVNRAEQEIQEIGRGRRVFPFNHVRVLVVAGPRDKEARARFAAVIDGPPSLSERLVDRLRAAGCTVGSIATEIAYTRERGTGWIHPEFHVEFDRTAEAAPAPAPEPEPPAAPDDLQLKLTVIKGNAERRDYAFTGGRIDIGRRAEVLDHRQRLIRTNDVAFADDEQEVNASVSRRHAHLEYSQQDGCYRVWDDSSAQGTSIIRGGRTIRVPPGARGGRIENGDELVLGQARLRVTLKKGVRSQEAGGRS
jgi:hypothetical protein